MLVFAIDRSCVCRVLSPADIFALKLFFGSRCLIGVLMPQKAFVQSPGRVKFCDYPVKTHPNGETQTG
jgi:hypothetical protein